MGQEINEARFSRQDFITFHQRLAEETALLAEWFRQGRFDPGPPVAGFELEAW
ncbi:MAG TPA: glutamate--cysteine ligase, partial [Gammaproteobacteria bacterium]|nr:glutamate--cysteine ligase [Gammaproteobacteria bacterium]